MPNRAPFRIALKKRPALSQDFSSSQHADSQVSLAQETSPGFTLPLHPLLFAAFPVLSLYAHNIEEVPLKQVWTPLELALLGTLIIWALVALTMRHLRKGAIVASLASLLFFSYGHIANTLPAQARALTAPLCAVGLLLLFFAMFRNRSPLVHLTTLLNLVAITLLFPSGLAIAGRLLSKTPGQDEDAARHARLVYKKKAGAQAQQAGVANQSGVAPRPLSPSDTAKLPDIYYIILDAYGRADTLQAFYGIDNTPFVHALETRGFYVAKESRSNYAQTGYCLPTYLNMNYLDTLLDGRNVDERNDAQHKLTLAEKSKDDRFEAQRRLIDQNAVAAFLRSVGYHYVYIWTGTSVSRVDTADLELDDDTLTPPESFTEEVFSLTALSAVPQPPQVRRIEAAKYDAHRAFIETAFHNLGSVPRLPYPKFVFAHILAPHPPFVFGPNGEPITHNSPYSEADGSQLLARISREEYIRGYAGQLHYINRRVLEAIDAIQRQSTHPPIIILQGDHGSRMSLDWQSQSRTDLREPYAILNAYCVPSQVRRRLYSTITPVNTFRILLSTLFGANYPVLPDRNFFATADHPFVFTEVTQQIHYDDLATPAQKKASISVRPALLQ